MDRQAQAGQVGDHRAAPGMQGDLVVGEEQHVVHVAHVTTALKLPLDAVIQPVQIDIGPELAGQVADG